MITGGKFAKLLTRNDIGVTNSHQAGVHVPKSEDGPLSILPWLDPTIKNPEAYIYCEDEQGLEWRFRFIYYNSKLHSSCDQQSGIKKGGTRNEYRLSLVRPYLTHCRAEVGDCLVLRPLCSNRYSISLRKNTSEAVSIVKLKGWQRVD